MPIEELQEPYWEKQKGETPNHYCYFLEFLEYPTFNLKDFHTYLCENLQKSTKINKVVKYQTLRKMSSQNEWKERKVAKRESEKEDLLDTLHELDKEDKIDNFKVKNSFRKKLLDRLEKEVEYEKLSQIKHGVSAFVEMSDDNRIDMEEPTTFSSQKLDVEAESKIQYENIDNLLEAFDVNQSEWNKRKSG